MKKWSLRWKVLTPVVGAILFLSTIIFVVSQSIITRQAEELALTKVRSDLNLMFELLEETYPGPWHSDGSVLYKGEHPLNEDNELVDWLATLTGNTVTIFREGTRVSTTVYTETGERAVGTQASTEVIDQVLKKGQNYYGKADVAGNLFLTGYRPLFGPDGKVVGMLYTGASPEIVAETIAAFRERVSVVSLIVNVLLVAFLYYFLSRRVLRPISRAASNAAHVADGDLSVNASAEDLHRGDEIGVLSRAFQELVDSMRQIVDSLQDMTSRAASTGENLLAVSEENSASIEEVASSVGEFSMALAEVSK